VAFWANHAAVAAILAPLAVIVAHWLPSPYAAANSKSWPKVNGAAKP
jgi:hypothetical protein